MWTWAATQRPVGVCSWCPNVLKFANETSTTQSRSSSVFPSLSPSYTSLTILRAESHNKSLGGATETTKSCDRSAYETAYPKNAGYISLVQRLDISSASTPAGKTAKRCKEAPWNHDAGSPAGCGAWDSDPPTVELTSLVKGKRCALAGWQARKGSKWFYLLREEGVIKLRSRWHGRVCSRIIYVPLLGNFWTNHLQISLLVGWVDFCWLLAQADTI